MHGPRTRSCVTGDVRADAGPAGALTHKSDVVGALARLLRGHRPTQPPDWTRSDASKSPLVTIKGDDYLIY